jgi:hypothetical protein
MGLEQSPDWRMRTVRQTCYISTLLAEQVRVRIVQAVVSNQPLQTVLDLLKQRWRRQLQLIIFT